MATIDLGKIKQVFRGTYDNSTAYAVDDLVVFTDGSVTSTYICTTASTGNNPSSGGTAHANWAFVAKGQAVSPTTTQGDIIVRGASADTRLAIGSAGSALKVNSSGNGLEYGTAGATIKVEERTNGTRTAVNSGGANNAYYELWESFTTASPFVKTRADTHLHVEALLIGHSKSSYPFFGTNFRIRNTTGSTSVDITEREGVGYIIGAYVNTGGVHWYTNNILTPAQCGNQAASFRLGHGWSVANGQSARPFQTWNPNNSDESRGYQQYSWARITELLI
jgi:hypothetical protein|tara:strand:+ start:373 stop:1209 length:837 start_codon:yes stop_codon:yes gene_type:complete